MCDVITYYVVQQYLGTLYRHSALGFPEHFFH